MFIYKSRFLTRAEVWFDDEPGETQSVDLLIYSRRSKPVPGTKVRVAHTYLIDLTQSVEQLEANLNKETAYKIRRAERDKVKCERLDPKNPRVVDEFEQMYNVFAKIKGLQPLHRGRMESLAAASLVDLSAARNAEGKILVYHANYYDGRRASGMELPSLFRTLSDSAERNSIGRANRLLNWHDILSYKADGLEAFDFGGWYVGTNPEMLNINEVKRGYGGQVIREYDCEQVLTFKGRMMMAAAAMLNRAKLPTQKQVHANTKTGEVSPAV